MSHQVALYCGNCSVQISCILTLQRKSGRDHLHSICFTFWLHVLMVDYYRRRRQFTSLTFQTSEEQRPMASQCDVQRQRTTQVGFLMRSYRESFLTVDGRRGLTQEELLRRMGTSTRRTRKGTATQRYPAGSQEAPAPHYTGCWYSEGR